MISDISSIVSSLKDDITGFAEKAVQTKSFTLGEKDMALLVRDKMISLGFDEVNIDRFGNVLGRIGSGKRALLFDGHMDTVGVNDEDQWTEKPFGGEIKGGRLYGRGSADTKCPLISAIFGAAVAKRAGLADDRSIYVSASLMEEDYDGEALRLLLDDTGLRPEGVVICEPTSLRIATGHRGRTSIEIMQKGVSCHGSTPELGVNPVYKLNTVISRVERLAGELSSRAGEHGSLALTNILCETASNNSVPQKASIILDRRLAVGETEEVIAKEMGRLLEGTDATWRVMDFEERTWKGYPFVYHTFLPAWEIDNSHPFIKSVIEAYRNQRGVMPELFKMGCSTNGVTSAGLYNIPSVVLGPGNLAQAHSRDEYCEIDELITAVGIHANLCMTF